MAEEKVARLELRIKQLEDQIKELRAEPEIQDVSADDIRVYRKVRESLQADFACGINECQPCIVPRPCIRCVRPSIRCVRCACVECVCGPCAACLSSPGSAGGMGRFSDLGE